jgi:hypothetical protein
LISASDLAGVVRKAASRRRFDALNAFWQALRGYRVAHPATVTAPVEG